MLRNLKIRTKILLVLAIVISFTLVVGIFGYASIQSVVKSIKEINEDEMPSVKALLTIEEAQKSVVIGERGLIHPRMIEPEIRNPQYKYISDAITRAEKAKKDYEFILQKFNDAEEKKLWEHFTSLWDQWRNDSQKVVEMSKDKDRLLAAGMSSSNESIKKLDEQIFQAFLVSRKSFLPVEEEIQKMVDSNMASANDFGMSSEKDASRNAVILVLGILFGIIVSIVLAVLSSKTIVQSIVEIQKLMARAEKGDLTAKSLWQSKDEVGTLANSYNHFLDQIREIIQSISTTNLVLNKSSRELLSISETMASNSEETSAKTSVVSATVEEITSTIEENSDALSHTEENMNIIASSVEEMSGTIRNLASASEQISASVGHTTGLISQISGSINKVASSAQDVSSSVNNVATSVKEMNQTLNEVSKNCERSIHITSDASEKASDTNQIIDKLNASSKQIGKIINVINDIADQTNMLALNAAIEAAGAGEAGKGFAVVANEVKELAKQTAEATEEVSQQIESMQMNMTSAVKAVETITGVIKEINSITNTIAASVTEQSATTGEISTSILKAADQVNSISSEISDLAINSQNVTQNVIDASKGVHEIARSTQELSMAANEVAKSTEQVSSKINGVARTSKEISKCANEISNNMQEISGASSETSSGAVELTHSAKGLSEITQKLDALIKQFNI
ncbi:MAG: methyl-accepting chemotaxis protein [Clostridia bacterium]|nr:methyl-accepting chemotaxis protein [Clostridia bacterium]